MTFLSEIILLLIAASLRREADPRFTAHMAQGRRGAKLRRWASEIERDALGSGRVTSKERP